MKVRNIRVAPVLVQVYVNGRAGKLKMVMNGIDEELFDLISGFEGAG